MHALNLRGVALVCGLPVFGFFACAQEPTKPSALLKNGNLRISFAADPQAGTGAADFA